MNADVIAFVRGGIKNFDANLTNFGDILSYNVSLCKIISLILAMLG